MPLHMHFRWGVTLVGNLLLGFAHPVVGPPFRYRDYPGRRYAVEVVFEESRHVALSKHFVNMYKSFCKTGMETIII